MSVAGLHSAVTLYGSDRIKDRAQGAEHIREIFSNPENLLVYQDKASRDGGSSWLSLFHSLFQVVILEKKAVTKKDGKVSTAQAEKRLAEAISLVRWVTERCVHLIAKKPFMALYNHMVDMLVYGASLFQPAALDYAKALNKLLSYPPHLDALDPDGWKALMGICWAIVLDDSINPEEDWQDETIDAIEVEESRTERLASTLAATQFDSVSARQRASTTQAKLEMVQLLPVLLSTSAAPLLPPPPASGPPEMSAQSAGSAILLKIYRFFLQNPNTETPLHLSVLQTLNMVLGEFELNCRKEMEDHGAKLFPHLVGLWTTRNKALREQLVIALRILMPFLTHPSVKDSSANQIRETATRFVDVLGKETISRWGIQPLKLETVRLCSSHVNSQVQQTREPFSLSTMSAGFGFTYEIALTWAIIELYAECVFFLSQRSDAPIEADGNRNAKRQRMEDPITTLIQNLESGPYALRVLCLQVLIFIFDKRGTLVPTSQLATAGETLLKLLESPNQPLQAWALAGLSVVLHQASAAVPCRGPNFPETWSQAWTFAIRKVSTPGLSRAASHLASEIFARDAISHEQMAADVRTMLTDLDVRSPAGPSDSVCALFAQATALAKSDVTLYNMNLEDKALRWLEIWTRSDGVKSSVRLEQVCAADLLALLCAIGDLEHQAFPPTTSEEMLPDCPIVSRVLAEDRTRSMRNFVLYGEVPVSRSFPSFAHSNIRAKGGEPHADPIEDSLAALANRPLRISNILSDLLNGLVVGPNEAADANAPNSPESARRAIDLSVVAICYQAVLQINGIAPDPACLTAASALLRQALPLLPSSSASASAQHLMWRGLLPLVSSSLSRPASLWPIMLEKQKLSGIRPDQATENTCESPIFETLGSAVSASGPGNDNHGFEIAAIIWRFEEVRSVYEELVAVALVGLADSRAISATERFNGRDKSVDEDDFGPIQVADTDAMPQSKESIECQRIAEALRSTLLAIRLRGLSFLNSTPAPIKDLGVLNAWLAADGAKFVQLGLAMCDAVENGQLRLSVGAVDRVLAEIEEMIRSYGFIRDVALSRLVIAFLKQSASIWIGCDPDSSDVGIRAVALMKFMIEKTARGQVTSWQVRLALVDLIESYLSLDPQSTFWESCKDDDDDMDGSELALNPGGWTPEALVDVDARVRYRAATSAALVISRLSLHPHDQNTFYFTALQRQPGLVSHWDSFLTHLLWKLNCCVVSASLRPATLYHIFEIPLSTSEINDHVRLGLQAVASILGFASVPELLRPYIPVLMRSVLGSGQNILRTPFDVFGWQSAQEQARFLLDETGSNLLAKPEAPMYLQLCAAAAVDPNSGFQQHLDAAAALISAEAAGSGVQVRLPDLVIQTIVHTLPRLRKGDLNKLVAQQAESIVVELLVIVDLAPNPKSSGDILRQAGLIDLSIDLYGQLASSDALESLLEPKVDLATLVTVSHAWHKAYPALSAAKIVFKAIMRLSYACHETLLVNEQHRYIRAIALIIALYRDEFKHHLIVQTVIRETTQLLRFESIWPTALAILQWGYEALSHVERPLHQQAALLVSLGRVYRDLSRDAESIRAHAILSWVQECLKGWRKQPSLSAAIEQVHCVWPPDFQRIMTDWTLPTWTDLSLTLENQLSDNSLQLCKQLAALQTRTEKHRLRRDFKNRTFWQIKTSLPSKSADLDGMMALLDLLYSSDGVVEPPRLLVHNEGRTNAHDAQRAFSAQVRTKYATEPVTAMRMLLVAQVVRLVNAADIQQRKYAIGILASMLPHISDLVNRSLLGADTNDLLSVIIPSSASNLLPSIGSLGDRLLEIQSRNSFRDPVSWSRGLANILLQHLSHRDQVFHTLTPLVEIDVSQTRELLPWLVQIALLSSDTQNPASDGNPRVQLSDYFTALLNDAATNIKILETLIKIVLHLRNYMPLGGKNPLAYNHWLDVDPMCLASAAVRCGAFASALLFLELAGESDAFDLASAEVQNVGLDWIILPFEADMKIMYAIYSNVEDPDGFYGIQTTDPESALIRRLEHEGQSWRAFGVNGALHEATSDMASRTTANAVASNLHNMGFNTLASTLVAGGRDGEHAADGSQSLAVELAWRTGNWELPISNKDHSIHTAFYLALRSVHRNRSQAQANSIVQTGIQEELDRLRTLGIERITDVKSSVASLLCMREIAVWLAPAMQTALAEGDERSPQLANLLDVPAASTYYEAERLLSTRLSLIGAAKAKEMINLFGDMSNPQVDILNSLEKACRIKLSELAREDGNSQAAVNAITAVRQLERGQIPSMAADDEFAQVLWSMGEHSLATKHVEQMSKRFRGDNANSARLAVLLGRVADWSSLAQTKPAQEIKRYFDEAIQLGRAHSLEQKESARLNHEYACFADRQLLSITKSPELDRLRTYTQSNPSSAELSATLSKSTTKRGGSSSAVEARIKETQEDEAALTALEKEIKTYVKTALRMFATALCYSNEFDDSMTRLCSLWLEYEEHEEVNKSFAVSLSRIPSHKFIFLGPQLTARLNRPAAPTTFDGLLNDLILRISRDHPFHILYQIITLSHGVKAAKGASRVSNVDAEGRGPAALEVLKRLEADGDNILSQAAVSNMRRFVETAIPWCLYKEPENAPITPEGEHGLPPTERLASLKAVPIPVSTVSLAIDPTKKYANVPTIMRYRQRYRLLGGLHKPKRMSCVDSLGAQHYELFKGEDEVRQDAVMEQVFQLTNDLLTRDRKSKSRTLRFRTYNVIPLPKRTGVIEFVSDGQGIGEWLKPAHERYRKDIDHSPDSMRKQLNPIQEKDWNSPKMTDTFNKLLLKFKPVMRHFFTEKHKDPMAWFAMRLNYSRSVAVTSMVGHVLGIGDRHCSNILIDTVQGELVHIDFGIVFEEGRRLRVPEKVPFRLTNDIVDGLGITGIEGTFRRCSEHSLRVLRESADLILTVLEVFKHDPLYAWTADSEKLQRAQGGRKADAAQSSAAGQEKADRILARIRQKLRPDLSVEFTVGQLIQEARDVENLSKIFVGWQPWL